MEPMPTLEDIVQLLRIAGWHAYYNALAAGPRVIDAAAYYDRAKRPRPGDLVLETSSMFRKDFDAVGFFVETKREFVEYIEEPGGYHDDFTYIRNFRGEVKRWRNCEFIVIPTTAHFPKEPSA